MKNSLKERRASPGPSLNSTSSSSTGSPASPSSAKSPDPEVLEKARRRSFTAEYKLRVLREADAAKASGDAGAIGELLRREGLYSSHLVVWREQRESSELAGLTPAKRGRKPTMRRDPLALEVERLRRENARLQDELRKSAIVIDVQKKVAMLLGIPLATPPEET